MSYRLPNVLHAARSPESNPRLNQCARWAEVPCVKVSGLTRPVAIRCSRSSPTAAAAFRAASTSLLSTIPR